MTEYEEKSLAEAKKQTLYLMGCFACLAFILGAVLAS